MEQKYKVQEVPGGWAIFDNSKDPPEAIVSWDTDGAKFLPTKLGKNFILQNEEYIKLKEEHEELEKNFKGLKLIHNEQREEYENRLEQAEEFAIQATKTASELLVKIMEALGWEHPVLPFPESVIEEIIKLRQNFEQTTRIAKAILNDKNEN